MRHVVTTEYVFEQECYAVETERPDRRLLPITAALRTAQHSDCAAQQM